MMTIKEISTLTGISTRTLRYYDSIDLLCPTEKTEAGYRLYDEKALERLQQILYFRELDFPLKSIKEIIENPTLDRMEILQMQKEMLLKEKSHLECLIESIDHILQGTDEMDFSVFSKDETEELFQAMLDHMPENMKEIALEEFGSVDQWREHYIEAVSKEKVQKQYAKIVEWYGGKEAYISSVKNPVSKEVAESYQKRIDHLLEKLSSKQNLDVSCFEVRELVAEYGFVMKQLLQLRDEKGMMLAQAKSYKDDKSREILNEEYGNGFAEFLVRAIQNFYNNK